MGITAWIALGLAMGLLANMLLPGKRSRALIFICLTCFMLILGGLGLVHARRVSRQRRSSTAIRPTHGPGPRISAGRPGLS